jgi:mRNA interferase MazF
VVAPAIGAVVLLRFPFLRPLTVQAAAIVLADAGRGDRILCQVTSKPYGDEGAIELDITSFTSGSRRVTSYARPGKLFTASHNLVARELAVLKPGILTRVVDAVVALLRSPSAPRRNRPPASLVPTVRFRRKTASDLYGRQI